MTSLDDPEDSSQAYAANPPRMMGWVLVTLMLLVFALSLREVDAGKLLGLVAAKGLLVALGGLMGYWLDRELFPYARPHQCMDFDPPAIEAAESRELNYLQVASSDFTVSMLRRSIIVAACLICMALGGPSLAAL
ncbi:MAG: hypothetical protein RL375_3493 [Pseudomonadota bacterium]|jgi:hypothetical protein